MALFKTFRGNRADLPNVAKVDGYAYFCIDDGTFWIDYKDSSNVVQRKQINKEDWTADITAAVEAIQKEFAQHTHTYTPTGSVSQPTFTGTAHKHSASFTGTEQTVSVDYTPAGTVSKPNVTVTPSTTTVNSITAVGTLPSASLNKGTLPTSTFSAGTLPTMSSEYTAETQTLALNFNAGTLPSHSFNQGTLPSLDFNAGTLPTKGANTTVMTGATAALASTPTFTGTKTSIGHTFTPTGSVSIENTTAGGTVSKPTFTGNQGTTSVMTN